MYKLLLCSRYLCTRYLALICIISVLLGVATLIVVNSVMSGFSSKLKERLHGLLSDVVIESPSYGGFPLKPAEMMKMIQDSPAGKHIEAMSPTVEVFAMMQYRVGPSEPITRAIRLIGIDPESRSAVGGFSEFLLRQKNNPKPEFELTESARKRTDMMRRPDPTPVRVETLEPNAPPPLDPPPREKPTLYGAIVGHAIASFRQKTGANPKDVKDVFLLEEGDNILVTTVGAQEMLPVFSHFFVTDYVKTEMSEYDSNYVFVPLTYLQQLRAMEGRVTNLQIRLKDYQFAPEVVATLKELFPTRDYMVQTWEDKQGPLLSAIAVERGILNVLLFMIVGVAGFSILAIFSMIVAEKTRDIGILKSLGASHRGVMSIFLTYGLLLGVVGALLGTGLGLWITDNLNEIEQFLAKITGQDIFPRDVYYFDKIPTNVELSSVGLVNFGAILTAVIFSLVPAMRAAYLHPVRALRYD
ncbi:ABC transporter permease [Tuwongella immobilis]|uniref:ABC3 transporter permease C-terminal domain-containing protein n=1 Tax=Tuwongella immobilis TaxID=692036 RepID=A0A6C2YXZ4_9BACT|nr:FtsX-like permease family protein [Tuwongella immobilis]VIP05625.1 membrane protein : ABC-type transport system, involved in lipoprotein release, permease component OS=Singulisphaera acidiphila (strain ATCC BAA-1392 / DSM 18658 / VKM B-2454 / MOB10) GN=Sinac_5022 PE=4 SV=1: MacB_PCD: FtsX [Tuwongella immobilis]VTS08606.1 membrane protein : ABC-type transport system, involved in lipoprotein release, permease component OS=Singulisphaera acidiphila (strain ATCC BAA-1392 / DSM 18658 / VKM B-2454 /